MPELICPSCKTSVSEQAIAQVEQTPQFVVSHARCAQCLHAYMIVHASSDAQTTLMLRTELTHPELLRLLKEGEALSSNDVLSLHELLSERNSTQYLSVYR
ncbi:MAG: hypothetical protein KIH62_001210 [Candidatus Kerfeldbacteria bacterium]|nr:hypothetical protein [Candidatus Kerfeldbacteria bacterium]